MGTSIYIVENTRYFVYKFVFFLSLVLIFVCCDVPGMYVLTEINRPYRPRDSTIPCCYVRTEFCRT